MWKSVLVVSFWFLLNSPPVRASSPVDISSLSGAEEGAAGTREGYSIGPGRVRFSFSGRGKWLGFFPAWSSGRSLFEGGGIVLLARQEDGSIVEIARTGGWGNRIGGEMLRSFACFEGVQGGRRAPSQDPDDDGDGKIDEDQLDGVDNDGDELIDEDFAAIGDEMVVVEYAVDSTEAGDPLLFHQECYAWSLSHINEMVVISLRVRWGGARELEGVRIGAFLRKKGAFRVSGMMLGGSSVSRGENRAVGVLSRGERGEGFALLFFRVTGGEEAKQDTSWVTGVLRSNDHLAKTLSEALGEGGNGPEISSFSWGELGGEAIAEGETSMVFGISPEVGTIQPGEEIGLDIALVATRPGESMDKAVDNAYKTFLGDGQHRYLPPPVSLTPRLLWGTYQRIPGPDGAVVISVEKPWGERLGAGGVSFWGGIDRFSLEALNSQGDKCRFLYRGRLSRSLFNAGEPVVLKGRTSDGEIFDLVLEPGEEDKELSNFAEPSDILSQSSEAYWNEPGKLEEELLKSSPNPFREATTIFYEIPSVVYTEDGTAIPSQGPFETSVKIYNVMGRLVSVLVDDILEPGSHYTDWRACDENGAAVASGVYYVKLQIEKRYITKRLILLK